MKTITYDEWKQAVKETMPTVKEKMKEAYKLHNYMKQEEFKRTMKVLKG